MFFVRLQFVQKSTKVQHLCWQRLSRLAQHWSRPRLINIWLSRLPGSNVISVTRMVEEGWSREADCSPAPLPRPVALTPASLETSTYKELSVATFSKTTPHNLRWPETPAKVSSFRAKNKTELWGSPCCDGMWQAGCEERDPEPTVCQIDCRMSLLLLDPPGLSIRAHSWDILDIAASSNDLAD